MDLYDARDLALKLMKEHGVIDVGWRFAFSNAKHQFGVAQIRKKRNPLTGKTESVKTIKLSRYMAHLNSEAEVRDTILHEIAHAIAGVERGHDETWQAVCRRIGAKPVRLAGEDVRVVAGRYVIVCTCCSKVLGHRHRRIRKSYLDRLFCRDCGANSLGKLQLRYALPSVDAASD